MGIRRHQVKDALQCLQKYEYRYGFGFDSGLTTIPQVVGRHVNRVLRRFWMLESTDRSEWSLSVFHGEELERIREEFEPQFVTEVADQSIAMLRSFWRARRHDAIIPQAKVIESRGEFDVDALVVEDDNSNLFLVMVNTGRPDIEALIVNGWDADFQAAVLLYQNDLRIKGYVYTIITRPEGVASAGITRHVMETTGRKIDDAIQSSRQIMNQVHTGYNFRHRDLHCNWCAYKQLCILALTRNEESAIEAGRSLFPQKVND